MKENHSLDNFSKFNLFTSLGAKMVNSLRLEDKLEGANNFRSWRTRILFVLEENEIQNHVKTEITEPEGEEKKTKYRKNEGKAKRILIDLVKDHLIPHISE